MSATQWEQVPEAKDWKTYGDLLVEVNKLREENEVLSDRHDKLKAEIEQLRKALAEALEMMTILLGCERRT